MKEKGNKGKVVQVREADEIPLDPFMEDQVPFMDYLLQYHPPDEIDAVLRWHHKNNIDVKFLELPLFFAIAYNRLRERYMFYQTHKTEDGKELSKGRRSDAKVVYFRHVSDARDAAEQIAKDRAKGVARAKARSANLVPVR